MKTLIRGVLATLLLVAAMTPSSAQFVNAPIGPAGPGPGPGGTCNTLGGDLSGTCANATVVSVGGKALTLGGAVIFSGAFGVTFTFTGTTGVTFPTTGTLATTSQLPSLPLSVANGGTGGGTASGTLLDNITGFSSTGIVDRTGAGAYSFLAAPSGTIVGTTDSQTLTNKSISWSQITSTPTTISGYGITNGAIITGTPVSGDIITGTGSALGIQDSGTLASSLAPKNGPSFTGTVTFPDATTVTSTGFTFGTGIAGFTRFGSTGAATAEVTINGAASAAYWGASGLELRAAGSTYTDTSSSVSAGAIVVNSFAVPTIAASNVVTYAGTATVYIAGAPTSGANVTSSLPIALWVAAGQTQLAGNLTAASTVNMPGLSSSSAGTTGTLCWTTGTGNVIVDTTTTCLLSLEELKDIRADITGDEALADIMAIKPLWGSWKKNTPEYAGDKAEQPFLGAHQVASVDKRLAAYNADGTLHGVRYQEMTAVLVAAIQKQQGELAALQHANDNSWWHSIGVAMGFEQ